jgi:inhibitor of cysteine peptidase
MILASTSKLFDTKTLDMRASFVAFLIAVVLLSVPSCRPGGEVTVGEAENGSRVTLEVGQILVLILASNPTTGYQWEITELDQAIVEETDHEYQADQPTLAGSGGKEIWRFQAQASGTTTLSLEYRRPWEENVEPIETFGIEVEVQ